jgi:hypothetical protein
VAAPIFFLLEPFTLPLKKRLGGLGLLPKNCSTKGGGFELNSFGGELVEGKKILFQPFNASFNGWLVRKLEFYFLSLPWCLSFVWSKLELSIEGISVD